MYLFKHYGHVLLAGFAFLGKVFSDYFTDERLMRLLTSYVSVVAGLASLIWVGIQYVNYKKDQKKKPS